MRFLQIVKKVFWLLLILVLAPSLAWSLTLALPSEGNDIVGNLQTVTVTSAQSLYQVARHFDVGYVELLAANPELEKKKLPKRMTLTLPTQFILPPGPREGIVINVAEMRLYYYPANQNVVLTFPVGIGKQGWATPTGSARVYEKVENPTWHVPASISESLASQGIYLPNEVQPGPLNPLGNYALRITLPGYLIHGTNAPSSIGTRSSSGCIRLYPEDIQNLFNNVVVRDKVRIINEPYKIGMESGKMYLEAHKPLLNDQVSTIENLAPLIQTMLPNATNKQLDINWQIVTQVAQRQAGVPQLVGVANN